MGDVKKMDYTNFRGVVTETHTIKLLSGFYYQPGVLPLLRKRKDYDAYILLGETRAISTWLFSLLARFFPKKKIFFWSHGWYGKESKIETFLKKILFRLPNGGTFLYGNHARNLMIKEGFSSEKLYVIHNSLAYSQHLKIRKDLRRSSIYEDHFNNTNFNLIFVGRLTPVKRLDQLLYALSKCEEKGYCYNLTLVGEGSQLNELKVLTENLGLAGRVWFFGSSYDEVELANFIYNADLCVSPGNVGLTAIHSMTFGTPVLSHNCFKWQMPEYEAIKEGETGSFFEINDINSLADSIISWLEKKSGERESVRKACMDMIDMEWNPLYQINLLKKVLLGNVE
ncbi:MAG: glycosyltransferase [Paludibacteraceae bacterium]|nr:glycosyltransferase [Paludibacteraceae bacterium]